MFISVLHMWRQSFDRVFTTNEKLSLVSGFERPMSGTDWGAVSEWVGRLSKRDHNDLKVLLGPLLPSACCVRILNSSEK